MFDMHDEGFKDAKGGVGFGPLRVFVRFLHMGQGIA